MVLGSQTDGIRRRDFLSGRLQFFDAQFAELAFEFEFGQRLAILDGIDRANDTVLEKLIPALKRFASQYESTPELPPPPKGVEMKMSFRVDLFGPFFSTVDGWLRRGGR